MILSDVKLIFASNTEAVRLHQRTSRRYETNQLTNGIQNVNTVVFLVSDQDVSLAIRGDAFWIKRWVHSCGLLTMVVEFKSPFDVNNSHAVMMDV